MKGTLLAVLVASMVVPGCDRSSPRPKDAGKPPVMLSVGHVGHDHHLALYVAALEGERFRKDYGIYLKAIKSREVYDLVENGRGLARLRFIKVGGGSRMPAAMSRGEIQIGLGGVLPVTKFADRGQPFKIICPLQTDGDMLVMQKDSPVTDWPSFVSAAKGGAKPLKIGYKAPLAVAKLVFERALRAEGIPHGHNAADRRTRVILVNFGSEKSPLPLMETRSIDGFVMNQPGVAVAVHKGLGKVVAELRDLPPKGKWVNHPCCCVCATQQTLKTHPGVVKAFLKLILLSTRLIKSDQQLAIDCAARWTKYDKAIEKASIPTIVYIAEPTDTWVAGMNTWADMVRDVKLFTGRYAGVPSDEIVRDVCSLELCRAAARELRRKGLLERK